METSNFTAVFYDEKGNPFDTSDSKFNLLVGSGDNSLVTCNQDDNDRWSFRFQTSNYTGTTYIKVGLRKINTTIYLSPEIPIQVQ
jgi:hypothetical protein